MSLRAMFARQRVHFKGRVTDEEIAHGLSDTQLAALAQTYRNTGHPRIAEKWEATLKQRKESSRAPWRH